MYIVCVFMIAGKQSIPILQRFPNAVWCLDASLEFSAKSLPCDPTATRWVINLCAVISPSDAQLKDPLFVLCQIKQPCEPDKRFVTVAERLRKHIMKTYNQTNFLSRLKGTVSSPSHGPTQHRFIK